MQHRTDFSAVTVPVPDHAELKIGTLQSIIRQSRIARNAFES
ncbi:MAG: type II toxin-antitoxin system HicA family toxin [Nitrospira sp.]|nr:type II toxin-antitoxin system HicA family toxin [Nitrospira sp.]